MGKVRGSKNESNKDAKENHPYSRSNSRNSSINSSFNGNDSSLFTGFDLDSLDLEELFDSNSKSDNGDHEHSVSITTEGLSSQDTFRSQNMDLARLPKDIKPLLTGEAKVLRRVSDGHVGFPGMKRQRSLLLKGDVTKSLLSSSFVNDDQRHVTPAFQNEDSSDLEALLGAPKVTRVLGNSQKENCGSSLSRSLSVPASNAVTPSQAVTFYGLLTPPLKLDRHRFPSQLFRDSSPQEGPNYFNTRLSEELMLYIFQFLCRQNLSRCLRVCKKWFRVCQDESLWRRVDLSQKSVSPQTMGQLFNRGTTHLRLSKADIGGTSILHNSLVQCSRLQLLDLSMVTIESEMLNDILAHCRHLRKLSLEHVALNNTALHSLAENTELNTLNLTMCTDITEEGMLPVLAHCKKLESLSLAWTGMDRDCCAYVCSNLPSSVRFLNIAGCRRNLTDDDVVELVKCCPYLVELDVSDCLSLTENTIDVMIRDLHSLRCLSINRCYSIDPSHYFTFSQMESLETLNVMGMLHESHLDSLRDDLPSVAINQHIFSTIARPTVVPHVRSIWQQKVWRNFPAVQQ